MIKQFPVNPVSVVDLCSNFLSSRQILSENTKSFAACFKGKPTTCSYSCICPKDCSNQVVDFTDIIVKIVLVTRLADDDIRRKMLGRESLDKKDINETNGFIEVKKMARDGVMQPAVGASVSSYNLNKKKT